MLPLHSVLNSYEIDEKFMLDDVNIDFLEDLEKKLIQRKNKHTGKTH